MERKETVERKEMVVGMDVEAEDGGAMLPLMLAGRRSDGVEEDVATLDASLIRQSSFLTGTRWSDKNASRVVVDIHPQLLHLLVRFGNLVLEHNRAAKANAGPFATEQLLVVPVEPDSWPFSLGPQNRSMHLPHVIGYSPQLAEFLDLVAEKPYVVYQCAAAAEMMLWEPARTAFLYKFGNLLRGMSIPFMEHMFPKAFFISHLQPTSAEHQKNIQIALNLTNKFFQPSPLINKSLLPPIPLPILKLRRTTSATTEPKPKQKKHNPKPNDPKPNDANDAKPNDARAKILPPPAPAQADQTPAAILGALQRWIDNSAL